MPWSRKWTPKGGERGAAAVEFVIIFPVLFLIICGIIEFGRIMAYKNLITSAAREGARTAILPGASADDVIDKIVDVLKGADMDKRPYEMYITFYNSNPNGVIYELASGLDLSAAGGGNPVTITVRINFSDYALVPGFMDWIVLDGTVTMRKENMTG